MYSFKSHKCGSQKPWYIQKHNLYIPHSFDKHYIHLDKLDIELSLRSRVVDNNW